MVPRQAFRFDIFAMHIAGMSIVLFVILFGDRAQAAEGNGVSTPVSDGTRSAGFAPDLSHETAPSRNALTVSPWRFEMSYGVSSSEMTYPTWKTVSRKSVASEASSVVAVSDLRVNHSFELPLSRSQSVRAGLSLSKVQSGAALGIGDALGSAASDPAWRTWGFGSDVFMVRRLGPGLEIDAGVVGDYFIGGVAEIRGSASRDTLEQNRLEQKAGWRLGFCGGIGGLYAGPIGLVFRLGSYWTNLSYREHPKPVLAQGAQLSIGFVLNLARGDW